MLVLGINKVCNWARIVSDGRIYTCPTKEKDGELKFIFKKVWHSVTENLADGAEELVREGGKLISRKIK